MFCPKHRQPSLFSLIRIGVVGNFAPRSRLQYNHGIVIGLQSRTTFSLNGKDGDLYVAFAYILWIIMISCFLFVEWVEMKWIVMWIEIPFDQEQSVIRVNTILVCRWEEEQGFKKKIIVNKIRFQISFHCFGMCSLILNRRGVDFDALPHFMLISD